MKTLPARLDTDCFEWLYNILKCLTLQSLKQSQLGGWCRSDTGCHNHCTEMTMFEYHFQKSDSDSDSDLVQSQMLNQLLLLPSALNSVQKVVKLLLHRFLGKVMEVIVLEG